MHCGLEKCVAADGSVEWVAAHSKARLDPHLPPIAHSHTAPVPNARVADLSHPPAGTLPARGRQVPHLEPARPGSLFELELAGIKRRAEKNDSGLGAGGAAVCKYTPKIALQTCVCVIVCYSGATRRRSLDAGGGSCNVLYLRSESTVLDNRSTRAPGRSWIDSWGVIRSPMVGLQGIVSDGPTHRLPMENRPC